MAAGVDPEPVWKLYQDRPHAWCADEDAAELPFAINWPPPGTFPSPDVVPLAIRLICYSRIKDRICVAAMPVFCLHHVRRFVKLESWNVSECSHWPNGCARFHLAAGTPAWLTGSCCLNVLEDWEQFAHGRCTPRRAMKSGVPHIQASHRYFSPG